MGKTNKHISETEKRRDHPVNPTDVEKARRAEEKTPRETDEGPLISREPGKLFDDE
ncbi:MAG: hypothetical protein ACRD2J_01355 [Thermoanaerobaculia bacterium]